MTKPVQIPDESLRFLILGAFSAVVRFSGAFPVMVDHVEENYDQNGQVETFTIVTASGLRFRVTVDYEKPEPVPRTQEEKIEFRKAWDARVEEGKKTDG